VVEHHGAEVGGGGGVVRALLRAGAASGVELVDKLLVHGGDDAVRREGLHGERACDAHAGLVLVGAVVEQLHVGAFGDRGVDGGLAGDAGLPPSRMQAAGLVGPVGGGLAGDLPFLPGACVGAAVGAAELGVQRGAQGFEGGLRRLLSSDIRNPSGAASENPATPATVMPRPEPVRVSL